MRTLYVTNRRDWRAWLRRNHAKQTEIWLLYHKKDSGRPRIPYDDAVEEALCYGWIDSTVRSLDTRRYAQRFTPRKPGSDWSPSNRARLRKLLREGRMTAAGMVTAREARGPAPKPKPLRTPPAFNAALRRSARARSFFDSLAPGYKRQFVRWIAEARQPETRDRRIARVLDALARNRKHLLV